MNVSGLPMSNFTLKDYGMSSESEENVDSTSKSSPMSIINCTFMMKREYLLANMDSKMDEYTKLLRFKLCFPGCSANCKCLEQRYIHKSTRWILARGRFGKQLLLLKQNFETLSLTTFSLNVQTMNVSLIQSIPNCINKMNDSTFETAIREHLLNDFKKTETVDYICNIPGSHNSGQVDDLYKCCHRVENNDIQCEDVNTDTWMDILLCTMFSLEYAIYLIGPILVPSKLYVENHESYVHHLGSNFLNLKVIVNKPKESSTNVNATVTTDMSKFKNMPQFKAILNKCDVFVHNLKITEINMKIKQQRVNPVDYAPIGLLKSFCDSFVRCKIRKNRLVSECCNFSIFRSHQRDMRQTKNSKEFKWLISLLCTSGPSTNVGECLLGSVLWIVKLVIVIIMLVFYLIPTTNLLLRLLAHGVMCFKCLIILNCIKDRNFMKNIEGEKTSETNEDEKTNATCFDVVAVVFNICSMYFALRLMAQTVPVAVDIALYTTIGIIINAKVTTTYLILIALLIMYANNCFSNIINRYTLFMKTIIELLQERSQENVKEVKQLPGYNQRNIAIRVKPTFNDSVTLVITNQGCLRWRTSNLVLFIDKNNKPIVPRKFFIDACKMQHYACPGQPLTNYLWAFFELSMTVLFLLGVLIIALAFGETYELSFANQIMATLAGGLLPWIFLHILNYSRTSPSLDKSDVTFKLYFDRLLETYKQDWPIDDIVENKEVVHKDGIKDIVGTTKLNQIELLIYDSDTNFLNCCACLKHNCRRNEYEEI
ncbi:hypothetical protein CHS0354_002942 [Potamilus streckersoni]|uniref:Uncharacterized protein n=1 Tax=Potamilus streckersoni TaxID=2493646 RepID=A0AAE0VJ52_9BIVA|nr:hypothetical protein CHS0354_002942 [Potamilus streckersoni]